MNGFAPEGDRGPGGHDAKRHLSGRVGAIRCGEEHALQNHDLDGCRDDALPFVYDSKATARGARWN